MRKNKGSSTEKVTFTDEADGFSRGDLWAELQALADRVLSATDTADLNDVRAALRSWRERVERSDWRHDPPEAYTSNEDGRAIRQPRRSEALDMVEAAVGTYESVGCAVVSDIVSARAIVDLRRIVDRDLAARAENDATLAERILRIEERLEGKERIGAGKSLSAEAFDERLDDVAEAIEAIEERLATLEREVEAGLRIRSRRRAECPEPASHGPAEWVAPVYRPGTDRAEPTPIGGFTLSINPGETARIEVEAPGERKVDFGFVTRDERPEADAEVDLAGREPDEVAAHRAGLVGGCCCASCEHARAVRRDKVFAELLARSRALLQAIYRVRTHVGNSECRSETEELSDLVRRIDDGEV